MIVNHLCIVYQYKDLFCCVRPPCSCMWGNMRIWNVKNQFRNESSEFWLRNIIFIAEITVADSQYSGCVRRRVCQLLGRLIPRSDLHHILYFHAIIANLWTKNWTLILKSLKSMGTAYSDCEGNRIFHILKQSMKPINILGFQAKYSETPFEILTRQNN